MSQFAKGCVVVVGPEEGESLWQPLPSRGYITNKLTPYNTPYDSFSLGIQVLEPGAHIRRHAHERQHEVLFCYAGVTHEPGKSGGLDEALSTLLQQPFGPVMLIAIGVGIACYGLFCFARARHLDR